MMVCKWHGLGGLMILLAASLPAQDPAKLLIRYNIEVNPINYPQKTPKETMKSIVKALDSGRYDYFLAHLTDPRYVDARVREYQSLIFPPEEMQREEEEIAREKDFRKQRAKIVEKQIKDKARVVVAFNRFVVETRKNFDEDPVLLKELRLFARDGEWEDEGDKATGALKTITPRRVVLRKSEDRWFMDERSQ